MIDINDKNNLSILGCKGRFMLTKEGPHYILRVSVTDREHLTRSDIRLLADLFTDIDKALYERGE